MTAEEKLAMIERALDEGKVVYVSTMVRHTKLTKKVRDAWRKAGREIVKVKGGSLYLAEGRHMACADYCAITVEG